jgi:hypothetical protein
MSADTPAAGGSSLLDRKLPPVAELVVLSLALMISGGVYLAASLPKPPGLAPVVALLVAGAALTAVAVVMLTRVDDFAWDKFFLVAKWALLAYMVIAGILGFVFVYDHTRGGTLAVLLCTLAVFAVDVPTIIGFTVARYQETSRPDPLQALSD